MTGTIAAVSGGRGPARAARVGSRYESLRASTWSTMPSGPGWWGLVETELVTRRPACALEIVIDGIDVGHGGGGHGGGVARAAAGRDTLAISAGNYGGKLGKFHFHLHQLLRVGLIPAADPFASGERWASPLVPRPCS